MTRIEKQAEEACHIIAHIEGWTSAPVKESVYKAGFIAGAKWMREECFKLAEQYLDATKNRTKLLNPDKCPFPLTNATAHSICHEILKLGD